MIREDYIIRMIRQLAEAVARAVGLRNQNRHDEAVESLARSWEELLAVPRPLVEVTDDATLIGLLREPVKMRVAAGLLAEEANVLAARRDPVHAGLLSARAMRLYAAAGELDPQDDDAGHILELSRAVSPGTL